MSYLKACPICPCKKSLSNFINSNPGLHLATTAQCVGLSSHFHHCLWHEPSPPLRKHTQGFSEWWWALKNVISLSFICPQFSGLHFQAPYPSTPLQKVLWRCFLLGWKLREQHCFSYHWVTADSGALSQLLNNVECSVFALDTALRTLNCLENN